MWDECPGPDCHKIFWREIGKYCSLQCAHDREKTGGAATKQEQAESVIRALRRELERWQGK